MILMGRTDSLRRHQWPYLYNNQILREGKPKANRTVSAYSGQDKAAGGQP